MEAVRDQLALARCAGGVQRDPCQCREPGCLRSTRERKPYCTRHVLRHPYAAAVRSRVEAGEQEARDAERGRVRLDGVLCEEVLARVGDGSCTVERLARDVLAGAASPAAIDAVVSRMAKAGLVTWTLSRRRRKVVRLA